jgi:beta-galactosidase
MPLVSFRLRPLTICLLGLALALPGLVLAREQILLNGVWRFEPAIGPAADKPSGQWGEARVPGSWMRNRWQPFVGGAVHRRAEGGGWTGFSEEGPKNETRRVWYEREITIPAAWAGREAHLVIERVSTEALVLVDGVEVGRVGWPGGEVKFGAAARPGATQTLRLLVNSSADGAVSLEVMDFNRVDERPLNLATRGIIGDVWLESRPAGPRVLGVLARPSVREGRLVLEVDASGVDASTRWTIEGEARPLGWKGEARGLAAKPLRFGALGNLPGESSASAAWDWSDAVRWEPGSPRRYELSLTLRDAAGAVADVWTTRFGFRETWIEGRELILNGTPLRLRPAPHNARLPAAREAMRNQIELTRELGHNFLQIWPSNFLERGAPYTQHWFAEVADEEGMLLAGVFPSANEFGRVRGGPRWNDPVAGPALFQAAARRLLRETGNSPSILLWATTPNSFGHEIDQDPRFLGRKDWVSEADKEFHTRRAFGEQVVGLLRAVEPSRPIFTHHGTYVGDLHTLNWYPNWTQAQEQEEMLSEWARDGDLPFLPVEYDSPTTHSFHRGRNGTGPADSTEPWATEYAAKVLGARAYAQEEEDYRRSYVDSYMKPWSHRFRGSTEQIDASRNGQETVAAYLSRTLRAFRAWGATGVINWWPQVRYSERMVGTRPGEARRGEWWPELPVREIVPSPVSRAIQAANRETLAWIGGAPGNFTEKSHQFTAGETLRKQLVLLNDTRARRSWTAELSVVVDGAEIERVSLRGELEPGSTGFAPFAAGLPPRAKRGVGEIRAEVRVGDERHEDRFPFSVWPAPEPLVIPVAAYADDSATLALLREAGLRAEALAAKARPLSGQVLVVGREGLRRVGAGLGAWVREGGRLVILSPGEATLRSWGLRYAPTVAREVWPIGSMAGHPLAAFEAEEWKNWPGAGAVVEPRPNILAPGASKSARNWPLYGWRWGNTGSVSSYPIEKPHFGRLRPIFETEFDLQYSPLFEMSVGSGWLYLSSFDFAREGGAGPFAPRFLGALVAHAGRAAAEPSRPAVYLGDEKGRAWLRQTGLVFGETASIPAPDHLFVVGAGAAVDEAGLRAFVEAGGRLLVLPRGGKGPLGVRREAGKAGAFAPLPGWPELRGVSVADFRLRAEVAAPLVGGVPELLAGGILGRVTPGKGVAVFVALLPDDLEIAEKTYLHLSAHRLSRGLGQVLANLGGEFAADAALLSAIDGGTAPEAPRYHPAYREDWAMGDNPYRYYRW